MGILKKTFGLVIVLMYFSNAAISIAKMESYHLSQKTYDVCNKRKNSEDRSFCFQVFKSDNRSATASNFLTILKIAVDSAIGNAKKNEDILHKITENNGTKPGLESVVKECILAYDGAIGQWEIMVKDFEKEPYISKYDSVLAIDELRRCENKIADSKISEPRISWRIKVAFRHGFLNEDVVDASYTA